jgi:hypothetical protein
MTCGKWLATRVIPNRLRTLGSTPHYLFTKQIIDFIRRKYLLKMQAPEELTAVANDEIMNNMIWELAWSDWKLERLTSKLMLSYRRQLSIADRRSGSEYS